MNSIRRLTHIVPDSVYISIVYYHHFGKFPNLRKPVTFNEKIQWLKLNDHRSEYILMVDKYLAKDYVANQIGQQYIVPLLGVWDTFDQVDFRSLPNQFVLKWNHDSGSVVICKDKSTFDVNEAKQKLERGSRYSGFWYGREWPYKHVSPKLIAEEYLEDGVGSGELTDYKIHCFHGEPKAVQVISNRFGEGGMRNDYFTPDTWENFGLRRGNYSNSTNEIVRPTEMDEILGLAQRLAKDYPFMRVDFYIVNHQVYLGELTLYPASGFNPFSPYEYDELFGSWIDLNVGNRMKK